MIENKSIPSKIRVVLIYFFVISLGLLCLLPVWNMVCCSLSSGAAVDSNRVWFWPVQFSLKAYERIVADRQFFRSFGISVVRVLIGLPINLLMIVLMAYPLSKSEYEFRGRNIYMKLLIFAMLFSGGMIPTYLIVKKLNLVNTLWSLILPGAVPIFSVIMVKNFFVGIPKSLEESATIDGANPLQILFHIFIPCSKPSLATVALFSIVGHWNDFFGGLIYITKIKNYPLMVYIQSLNVSLQDLLKTGVSAEEISAALEVSKRNLNAAKIVVALIPLLLIYPFLQKYLLAGMTMGAVKE